MVPKELVKLIEKYCMGLQPTDAQQDEIFDKVAELNADIQEVADLMEKLQNGPTLEEIKAKEAAERKAKEEAERKKAEAVAKRKATLEKKKAAEQKAKQERERLELEEQKKERASKPHGCRSHRKCQTREEEKQKILDQDGIYHLHWCSMHLRYCWIFLADGGTGD